MKKLITLMIMVLAVASLMAQAPEKFSYQAVVRNASNALVTNAPVSVRVSILQGSANGSAVYVETLTATTNANGLLTIEIGGGTVQQGVFADIDWANGPFFLKTETDPNGGSDYSVTSTQQLLSVPYALYAKDAGNVPTVPANVSAFTNDAGYITAQDIPEIPTVPTNVSAFVNDVPYMTSFTEQQILTISNDTIFLTGGSFVKLPEGFNGDYNSLTNTPSIPTVPTNVSAFVNDMGYLTSFTEQQVLSISNDTIFLTGGSFVKLPEGFDGDYNSLTNTPAIPTVPTDVSVFNNDANYVSNTECADVDLCALAALVSGLQGQLAELQGQLAELQSTIDSLTVPDTTVTPVDTTSVVIDEKSCPNTPTVTDHEGNVYATVQIGNQCWMRDNLRTTTSPSTGTYLIPASSANYTYTGKQASWYNNDSATYAPMNYGLLYNWNAAVDTFNTDYGETSVNTDYNNAVSVTFSGHRRGICPVGWHLPSHAEWSQLTYYVGVNYACGGGYNNAKALASTTWWLNDEYSDDPCYVGYDPSTNNASGFGAVPAGYRYYGFSNPGYYAGFWSSTEDGSDRAYYRHLYYNFADMPCGSHSKHLGFSVRCLRDEGGTDTTQTTPAGEGQPCPGAATVTDYDGNVYNTVQIGDQCWMRENLRVTHYSDGTPILAGGDNDSFTTPYYYNNNSSFPLSERGYIYNWPAAMHGAASSSAVPSGVQGVCPTGWHLPSDAEWTVLEDYVGNIPEYQCGCSKYAKALTSTTGWNVSTNNCAPGNDQSTNNASGFGAVPAGYWLYEFNSAGYKASFWSSTEADSYSAYYYYLNYDSPSGGLDEENNFLGHSVRCLRNEGGTDTTQTTLPTVITGAVSDITETKATCGGEVTADGGAAVTERGVCWSTSATPTVADAHTSDGTGIGTFTSSITALTANTTYYVRAYATNSVGTGYGETVTFTTEATTPVVDGQPCPGTPTVTDHEGNVYATVQIGNQCWMRDNLRTTTSPSTGTYLIPIAGTGYTYTGKQARWYDNDSATYAPMNYGLLYNWNAAVDTFNTAYGEASVNTNYSNAVSVRFTGNRRGICPVGWHLPSDAEWTQLTNYVKTRSDYVCGDTNINIAKALASTEGWNTSSSTCAVGNNPSANNVSGFGAVPVSDTYGTGFYAGYSANFWSSTMGGVNGAVAYTRVLYYFAKSEGRYVDEMGEGCSVRCLRDESGTDTIPVVHGQPCPGTPTVTDYDGNVYNTVQIGNQCWTKENLRTTHYADGMAIFAGGSSKNSTSPYYYDYSSSDIALSSRGYLYNWPAAMHGAASSNANPSVVQGICPAGWHLPSDAEWTQLTDYMKTQSDYICCGGSDYIAKALASTTGWLNDEYWDDPCNVGYDPSTNNASGFEAVPAGNYWYDAGSGYEAGYIAAFWSSTENDVDSNNAYSTILSNSSPYMDWDYGNKGYGFSVRCLRNEGGTDTTQTTLPTVITGAVSDITQTTATCGGEVTSDGGATVTERGVCWSTSATPTVADAHTSEGTGTGTFTSSITGLTANTTYYVRAYATNSEGTGYGEQKTFITETAGPVIDEKSCPAAPTVTDHEGNVYATVLIGNQCWMRDNLRTTTSPSTGTNLIPSVSANYTYTGKQARWLNNDSATYAPMNYGLLYNWNAAVDTFNTVYGETSVNTDYYNAESVTFSGHRRGICPVGWHLPSDAEWDALMLDYVRGQSEYLCDSNINYFAKALAADAGWYSFSETCCVGNDQGVNNATGFSAVPAGLCLDSWFDLAGYCAYFWSSSQLEGSPGIAWDRGLYYDNARAGQGDSNKCYGYSVRCLRD